MQPDQCQKRQKVRDDVSLHRLCRYGGQNQKQTESGKQGVGERDREKQATNKYKQREGRERGERGERTLRNGASVGMRGRAREAGRGK